MKKSWFRKFGWIYIPISWQGIIVSIILLAFCVHIFIFVDSKSHSVSETFYGVFPFIIPAFFSFYGLGLKTLQKNSKMPSANIASKAIVYCHDF